MDKITLVIAIIGCVTGTTSLVIKLFEYFRTVPRMKIEIDNSNYSYFFNSKDSEPHSFDSNYSAIISLKISNCSVHPVTINSISVIIDGLDRPARHYNEFNANVFSLPVESKSFRSYPISPSIQLPARLDSYDTIYRSIRIPFFDKIVQHSTSNNLVTITISVITPVKEFRHKTNLYEYRYLDSHVEIPKH